MDKQELGFIFFVGCILRWYKQRGMCWRHGCMMDLHFSRWLPAGGALLLCPQCQAELMMPTIMTVEFEEMMPMPTIPLWARNWRL